MKERTGIVTMKGNPVTLMGKEIQVGDIAAEQEFLAAPVDDASGDRTRPNLKIQDGCGNQRDEDQAGAQQPRPGQGM